jgi:hypothetical protein
MKKLFFLVLAHTLMFSVLQAQSLPYSANYSSNFKVATHDLSSIVLQLYKGYESNDFSKEAWFADTVMAVLPNGEVLQGKETVLGTFKQARQDDGNTTFTFDAIIPLTSVDRKENWVCLWGASQTDKGKSEFHAIWRLNKNKKVDFIKLFNVQPRP